MGKNKKTPAAKPKEREENKRTKEATEKGQYTEEQKQIGGDWKFCKRPEFLKRRNDQFTALYEAQKEMYKNLPRNPIKVTVDGKQYDGVSFQTNAFDIAKMINKEKAKSLIVTKIRYPNGKIVDTDEGVDTPVPSEEKQQIDPKDAFKWHDATRPFEGDCELQFFYFEDEEGKETFWHSSAHVLGETMEVEFGVHLCHGPPTSEGFFYDAYTGKNDKFSEANYKEIEKAAQKIV